MNRKVIILVLALLTFVSVFAGCTKESNKGNTFETAPTVYYARKNAYEAAIGQTGDKYEDNDYVRYIYDKTGIRVVPVLLSNVNSEAAQQLAIKRAGGERIDLISYFDLVQTFMQSNLVIPLNDIFNNYADIIEGYNPYEENVINEDAWNSVKKIDVYWGIPGRATLPQSPVKWFYFRKDWLDKLHLDMPKNTDDLTKIFDAFTNQDPDGNGIKDTYGMSHYNSSLVNELLLCLGVESWREYIVNDAGEIDPNGTNLISQAMHPNARKNFALIRSWCKKGYFSEDGITDTNANEKMITNNKTGVILGHIDAVRKYTRVLHENGYPEAQWALCTNKIVNSIDGKFYGYVPQDNKETVVMITSMAKEEDYRNIFRLLNWMYSDEGTTFQSYGIEGKEYTIQNGKYVENEKYITDKSYLGLFQFGKSYKLSFPEQYKRVYGDDELGKAYIDMVVNHPGEYSTKRTDIKFQYPNLKEFTTYPDWRKGVESHLLRFTVGDKDPMDDATWNAYIAECEEYGIQKLMDAAAKVHFKK